MRFPLRGLAGLVVVMIMATGVNAAEKVIFDTDLGADCDDAGAFAVLHALADAGEVEILAMGIVNGHANAVPAADALNTWYGRGEIPIGVIKRKAPFAHDRYLKAIVDQFPHDQTQADAPDVVKLYRQVLARSEDASVTLIAIGPCSNIADLLESQADEHSPLSGVELVAKKVKFYAAGGNGRGNLPKGEAGWNYKDDLASAAREMELMPDGFPTVFAGGSGMQLKLGQALSRKPADNPIRMAYEGFHKGKPNLDRNIWDQLRVLYACVPKARGLFETSKPGQVTVDPSGVIEWKPQPQRNRAYAYVKDTQKVLAAIEELMLHEPDQRSEKGEKGRR